MSRNFATADDAALGAGCSPRWLWYRLADGSLTRYKAKGKTYVDVDELHDLLTPRPA